MTSKGSRLGGFLKGVLVGLLVVVLAIAALGFLTPVPETELAGEPGLPEAEPMNDGTLLAEAEPDAVVTDPEGDEIRPVEIEGLGGLPGTGDAVEPETPAAPGEGAEAPAGEEAITEAPPAPDAPAVDGTAVPENPAASPDENPTLGASGTAGLDQSPATATGAAPALESEPASETMAGTTEPPTDEAAVAADDAATTETAAEAEPATEPATEAGATGELASAEAAEPAMPPPLPDPGRVSLDGPAIEVNAASFDEAVDRPVLGVVIGNAGSGTLPRDVLLSVPLPVTLGILAGAEGDAALANAARARGWEVLAELPVEAPGPDAMAGALAEGMDEAEAGARTEALLARVEQAVAAQATDALDPTLAAPVRETLDRHGFGWLEGGAGGVTVETVPESATAEETVAALAAAAAGGGEAAVVILPPTRAALEGLMRWSLERDAAAPALAPLSAVLRRSNG